MARHIITLPKTQTIMLLKRALRLNFAILQSVKYSTATNRENYYKNLVAAHNDDTNPVGWEKAKPFESIPGPKPLPVLGNMWRFFPGAELYNINTAKMLLMFQERYGDVVHLGGIWGRRAKVFLYNPDDMADLFRNTGPFPSRLTFDYILYHRTKLRKHVFKGYVGLALSQGEDWYKLRTIVNPILMPPNKIQQYTTRLDTVAKDLIKLTKYRMKTAGTNQTPADFEKDLYKWALDSVSVITLNRQVGALETHIDKTSDLYQFVLSVLKIFEQIHYLELMPPYWKYLPSRRLKEFNENFEFSMSLISKFVDEALAEFKNVNIPDDELGVLQRLAKVNKQTAYLMTIDLITAGVDATGKTLGTALYLLAKNPEKQSILREEVLKYLPEKNSVLTAEKLSEMQYLKATLKESNRMAPVAIGGLRTTTKNMVLGGYQVPKGTDINPMHFYASALIDKNFKDPAKFMPERWLRSVSNEYSAKNAHPFAYMPFGHGARSCIGRRFAVMEVEVAIANIIRHFELSWDHSDMRFEARFLYGIVDPLTLTLKEIK